jgi:hypothetical protein
MMSASNDVRPLSAFIKRRNPRRRANSAPEIPSSWSMCSSATVQPFVTANARACSIWRVTLFRLVVAVALVGALAGVDGGDHGQRAVDRVAPEQGELALATFRPGNLACSFCPARLPKKRSRRARCGTAGARMRVADHQSTARNLTTRGLGDCSARALPWMSNGMATTPRFVVGDTVELRDAALETVGTVVAIMRDGHVKVAWATGHGYRGKTIMLSVRALRRASRSAEEAQPGT